MSKKEIARLRARLNDYIHYAQDYGNASGECETGYPQRPGYVCGMCGQDRSVERKCRRAPAAGQAQQDRRRISRERTMNYPHPMDDKTGFEATDAEMGLVTESIFNGKQAIVPLADVQHIIPMPSNSVPGIQVITRHTRWNHTAGDWANAIWISDPEAEAFTSAWCRYRAELEANTDKYPDEFLGRCQTCLNNAMLSSRPCRIGYGVGQPVHEDDCMVRRARKEYDRERAAGKQDG